MPVIEAVAAGGLSYCADNTALSELLPYIHGGFDASSEESIQATLMRAISGQDAKKNIDIRMRALERFNWASAAEAFLVALND